jgi:hypothetical protein
MIGKPEWFGRRKYSGWGITPKTWQGWVYIAAIIAPIAIFQALPFWSMTVRLVITGIWALFLAFDITDIMVHLKKDEREQIHEAISDRNAAWFMVVVLAIGFSYDYARNTVLNHGFSWSSINPFMAAALFGGLLVKAISNIYLERKS